ncbi:MAG TPA: M56 family metallopeptidase [Firmicutes bacterium]|nr:M56 family metallopeptidase [Bacillota bacterium]
MEELFLLVLNKSFAASWVIGILLLLRLVLRKLPTGVRYALWAVALVRLLVPISVESALSLLPVNPDPIPAAIGQMTSPVIVTGVSGIDQAVNPLLPPAVAAASANPLQVLIAVGTGIWLAGAGAVLLGGAVSLVRLSRRLGKAGAREGRVRRVHGLESPFVWGVLRPVIYLPDDLPPRTEELVLLHEEIHIRRWDQATRFLAYVALAVHWFNPLVWVAFFLSGQDMERSCDEAVIRRMGGSRKDYAAALLSLATGRRSGGIPLAFGEGDAKGRIRNILTPKRLAGGVAAVACVLTAAVGIALLLDPVEEPREAPADPEPVDDGLQALPGEAPEELALLQAVYGQEFWVTEEGALSADGRTLRTYRVRRPEDSSMGRRLGVDTETLALMEEGEGGSWQPVPEEEGCAFFARQLFSSLRWEDGTLSFAMPPQNPTPYPLDVEVRVQIPRQENGVPYTQSLSPFDQVEEWQPGEGYRAQVLQEAIPEESHLSMTLYFVQEDNLVAQWFLCQWTFLDGVPVPLVSLWDTVPYLAQEGNRQQVDYVEGDGQVFSLSLQLPEGWTLGSASQEEQETVYAAPVGVYDDGGNRVGTIAYSDFSLPEGVPPQQEYRAIYSGLMLGSVVNWDNEYTPVSQTDSTVSATVQVARRQEPGDVSAPVAYTPGVLAYHRQRQRYVAMEFAAGSLSPDQQQAIAASVVLA